MLENVTYMALRDFVIKTLTYGQLLSLFLQHSKKYTKAFAIRRKLFSFIVC